MPLTKSFFNKKYQQERTLYCRSQCEHLQTSGAPKNYESYYFLPMHLANKSVLLNYTLFLNRFLKNSVFATQTAAEHSPADPKPWFLSVDRQ